MAKKHNKNWFDERQQQYLRRKHEYAESMDWRMKLLPTFPFFTVFFFSPIVGRRISIKKLRAQKSETTNSRVRLAFDRRHTKKNKKYDRSGNEKEAKKTSIIEHAHKKCEKFLIQRCF